MPDADLRRQEQSSQRGNDSGEDIGAQMDKVDMNAVSLCGLFAKADRARFEAAARPVEPNVGSDCRQDDHDEGNGNKANPRS